MREDYAAAVQGVAVFIRPDRRILEVTGRAPDEMLKGILSGRIPENPREEKGGVKFGEVAYSTLLTPKGRMITDLRILRGAEGGLLLDLPQVGLEGALQHFRRYLPPRLAQVENRFADYGFLSVVGPEATLFLADHLLVGQAPAQDLAGLQEGYEILTRLEDGTDMRVVRNGDVWPPAFDLLLPMHARDPVVTRLLEGGVARGDRATWEVLRMEGGRPAFGADMNEETIPVEAGIHARAIDYGKGCYTGQEVIIRLRDRGQVNKRLLGFLLGSHSPPPQGTELFAPDGRKSIGWVTSSCVSPRFGQTIAFGYVRRSAQGEARLRLGSGDGPEVEVRELDRTEWS
jgi:folate-binding protein YgfZ